MNYAPRYFNLRVLFGITLGIILADFIVISVLALGVHFKWNLLYLFPLAYMGHFITGLLVIPLIGFLFILFQGCQRYKVKKFIKASHS